MQGPYLSLTVPGYRAESAYQRVSDQPPTLPYPSKYPAHSPHYNQSLTPYADAVNNGDFNFYPRGIYEKEPLYIPRYQPSGVWNIVRKMGGPDDRSFGTDPSAFSMKTGGVLPPRFSRYEPPDFAPGPLGPHPGLSYVECDTSKKAVLDPPNMAPARYYQ